MPMAPSKIIPGKVFILNLSYQGSESKFDLTAKLTSCVRINNQKRRKDRNAMLYITNLQILGPKIFE